ncbi:MAG: peptidylprolyl isomerase [Peptococcaceae bacterium]|jgi:peptidyl-prolyl cis-trans isomerase B (cyclophilin B)|nr:peptidylprolyl isomerase [Peptococcaceae bacterium]
METKKENPVIAIEMENGNQIKLEVYPEIAPKTVQNFVALVQAEFYDGLIFHRVIPGFMIQGGDPSGNGAGGSKEMISGEFSGNGFVNPIIHERGVISMARASHPDSASSQFFIVVKDAPHLDGQYAAFGRVLEGMEEVDRIVSAEKDSHDKPKQEQRMKKVVLIG